MIELENLTNEANQLYILTLLDYKQVTFELKFKENLKCWFFNVVTSNFEIYNKRLVITDRLLKSFKYKLNFDFLVYSSDLYEPVFKDDFINGRIKIYLLNSNDISYL